MQPLRIALLQVDLDAAKRELVDERNLGDARMREMEEEIRDKIIQTTLTADIHFVRRHCIGRPWESWVLPQNRCGVWFRMRFKWEWVLGVLWQ